MTETLPVRQAERVVDPILFEILSSRLSAINDEAAMTMRLVSGSPVANEAYDMNVGLMDADGECFAIGLYITIHALALSSTVKDIKQRVRRRPRGQPRRRVHVQRSLRRRLPPDGRRRRRPDLLERRAGRVDRLDGSPDRPRGAGRRAGTDRCDVDLGRAAVVPADQDRRPGRASSGRRGRLPSPHPAPTPRRSRPQGDDRRVQRRRRPGPAISSIATDWRRSRP